MSSENESGNPSEQLNCVPDRQPAYCPYCAHDGAFDGQRFHSEGYRHRCPECGGIFQTFLPDDWPEVTA